jgi:hypothetical protein
MANMTTSQVAMTPANLIQSEASMIPRSEITASQQRHGEVSSLALLEARVVGGDALGV